MNGIRLTGLWKETAKDGKTYLSGTLGAVKVLVFANEKKAKDGDPDYNLVLAPREEREKPARSASAPDPELGF